MLFLHRLHVTLWFPRTLMTTGVGWTKVEKSLAWSPLQHGQCKSLLSSSTLQRQFMHTRLLHSVSWIGWSNISTHSLQTSSAVTAEALSSCVTSLAGVQVVGNKDGGAMECMWSMALLILMVERRPGFRHLFFGRPPVLTFWKCSQTAHSFGEWLVQVKASTLWWYCLPSSTAFFDRFKTLKHPWQIKGGWISGLSSPHKTPKVLAMLSACCWQLK